MPPWLECTHPPHFVPFEKVLLTVGAGCSVSLLLELCSLLSVDVAEELVKVEQVLLLLHCTPTLHVETRLLVRPLKLLQLPGLVFVLDLKEKLT